VVGEQVEVLVLAQNPAFADFKVLRELYFPELDLFLADYPFVKRAEFARISADIDATR